MAFADRLKSVFFFINRRNLTRPVFWFAFLGMVFIVALMISVPMYITTRNQYCSTCHAMEQFYGSWERSTHAYADCVSCHVAPGLVNDIGHVARSTRELYTNLISSPEHSTNFSLPTNQICFACHTEYRTISASGDLLIPHKQHVKLRSLSCVNCHRYLVHYKNPEGKNTPSMTICYKCHNGVQASKDCKACHTKKSYPDTHKAAEWFQVHGGLAKEQGKECARCHGWTPKYCEECHQKRPPSHAGVIWRTNHKDAGKIRESGCYVCHGKTFCKNCHD